MWPAACAQINSHATDEAGVLVGLGGVANQASWFVDDQQVRVFVNDLEQFWNFHARAKRSELHMDEERVAHRGLAQVHRRGSSPE